MRYDTIRYDTIRESLTSVVSLSTAIYQKKCKIHKQMPVQCHALSTVQYSTGSRSVKAANGEQKDYGVWRQEFMKLKPISSKTQWRRKKFFLGE